MDSKSFGWLISYCFPDVLKVFLLDTLYSYYQIGQQIAVLLSIIKRTRKQTECRKQKKFFKKYLIIKLFFKMNAQEKELLDLNSDNLLNLFESGVKQVAIIVCLSIDFNRCRFFYIWIVTVDKDAIQAKCDFIKDE